MVQTIVPIHSEQREDIGKPVTLFQFTVKFMSLHEVETLLGPSTFWALFPRWILMLWQPHRYRTNEIFINGIKINFMIEMSSDKTSTLTTRKKKNVRVRRRRLHRRPRKKNWNDKSCFYVSFLSFFLSLVVVSLSFFFFETLWRFLWMLLLDLVLFIVGKWKDHSYIIKVKWTRCPSASLAANHVSAVAVKNVMQPTSQPASYR